MTFENKLQKIPQESPVPPGDPAEKAPQPTVPDAAEEEALIAEQYRDIFKKHGADVEGDIVRIDESTLIKYIGKAPARFTIEARNPKYNVDMGGGGHYAVPAYGSPYVEDFTGETRYSTLKDFIYFLKQIEALDDFHINGGILCQPNEYEAGIVTLLMWYAILRGSEKVLFCPAGNEK